ncbi:MAG TPA: NAD-dependent epimerase/dehydratase family protein [Zeimonas sp.]|nr:NAD-dependent epimerase/dehydratase family protein [Zeimonas sp.]
MLVTGATGFVGRAFVREALARGWSVRAAVRSPKDRVADCETSVVGELGADTPWDETLRDREVVVHLAARVHVMRERVADPSAEFRRVNVDASARLAERAAAAGVRRLVFASSVKVHGEERDAPYTEQDPPAPRDGYARSKCEAEERLRAIGRETGLEIVIVRPPLVYGPGVGGNFLELMRWLDRGIPLPFASIENARSLVSRDNLVDFLLSCARHPGAAGETFLVSDREDLSTPELLRRVAEALGTRARLFPVPAGLLMRAAAVLGRGPMARRLCASLRVDAGKAQARLGWTPPVPVDAALHATAQHFLREWRHPSGAPART